MITQVSKKITQIVFCLCLMLGIFGSYALSQQDKEEELFFIAQQALNDSFYDIARDYFQRYINTYPNSKRQKEAQLFLGQCFYHKGEYIKSLSIFENLLKDNEAKQLHDAVIFWAAQVYVMGKDFQNALNSYSRLIADFPDSEYVPFGYFYKAGVYFEQEKYSEAIHIWQNFIKQFPQHNLKREADFKIGEAMYRLQEYNSCLLHFGAFLRFYPKSPRIIEAVLYKAESEFYLNKLSDAIVDYKEVLKSTKDSQLHWQANLGLAWSYLKQKRYREAKEEFLVIKKEAVLKEIFVQAQFGMALLLKDTGNDILALDIYNEIIREKPNAQQMINAYIAKAELLYEIDNKLDDAINTYQDAMKIFSHEPYMDKVLDKIHYGLAWAYLKSGDFKKSNEEFQKVAKISDDKIVKISALCQAADTYLENDQMDQAIQIYDSLLENYPDSFYADYVQYQLGNSLYKKKEFDKALLSFRAVLNNFPDSRLKDETIYALALVYFSKGDFLAGLGQCDVFIKNFPEHSLLKEAFYIKGVCLYNLSRFKEAIEVFSNVQNKFHDDKELFINVEYQIADCFLRLGNENEALQRFKKFLASHPDSNLSAQIILWLSEYFIKQNDTDNARRYLRQLINNFSTSDSLAYAYYLFAQSYLLEDNPEKALVWFDKASAIAKDALFFKALLAKASALENMNRINDAIKLYEEIASKPNEFLKNAIIKIAAIHKKDGRYDEALNLLQNALDIQPDDFNPSVQFQIAEIFEEKKELREAVSEYLKVSYLYPQENALAVKSLLRAAELSERQNNWQDAVSFYNKIIIIGAAEAEYAQDRINWINKNILLTQK